MKSIEQLFALNREWAASQHQRDPAFFSRLTRQQSPQYLWIGCSDSRVPANQIVGLDPGEVFVHRNVANLVVQTDLNALSVIQFAVDMLKVKHILVVGHYGCGGIRTAVDGGSHGLIDNWLRQIQDLDIRYNAMIMADGQRDQRLDRLCELNVMQQVLNVSQTTIVQDAWQRQQPLTVHGWCYRLTDGVLHDLKMSATSHAEAQQKFYDNLKSYS